MHDCVHNTILFITLLLFTMLPRLFLFSLPSCLLLNHSYSQCLNHQKNLLLRLKNELIFNTSLSTKLVQWNQRDECCKWHGVECDGAGNVVSLQLDGEAISGGIGVGFRRVYSDLNIWRSLIWLTITLTHTFQKVFTIWLIWHTWICHMLLSMGRFRLKFRRSGDWLVSISLTMLIQSKCL